MVVNDNYDQGPVMGHIEEDVEKWLTHYSSNHQILLVGDGDFSFSFCLALSFGSAHNILATSLDQYDDVIKKYKEAKSNLERLQTLGAAILHGVDATKMKRHTHLMSRRFDRIIFNFPHAGFRGREDDSITIHRHRMLVNGFFSNAKSMLRLNGEIHVNHKTTPPFSDWKLDELATNNSLVLIECVEFKIEDYPSYKQKRGDGGRCDQPFPLGESSTFKFQISPTTSQRMHGTVLGSTDRIPEQFQVQTLSNYFVPGQFQTSHNTMFNYDTNQPPWRSSSLEYSYPQPGHIRGTNLDFDHVGLPPTNRIRNMEGHFRALFLPSGYLTEIQGRTCHEFTAPVNEVRSGFYGDIMTMRPQRTLNHVFPELNRTRNYDGSPFSESRLGSSRDAAMMPPGRSFNQEAHILPEFKERNCFYEDYCVNEHRSGFNRDSTIMHRQRILNQYTTLPEFDRRACYHVHSHVDEHRFHFTKDSMIVHPERSWKQDASKLPGLSRTCYDGASHVNDGRLVINANTIMHTEARLNHERRKLPAACRPY